MMFNGMVEFLHELDVVKEPTRKCLVCECLEDPTNPIAYTDKAWLCDKCKAALKKLVTKEGAE